MKISVLLPSLFPDLAHAAIEALRPQLRGIDHEFVIVSPMPFSGENIVWVEETERRGAVAAMQTASERTSGDLWLITSDDFRFSETAIAEALTAFSDPARPFPMALTYPHRMRAIDCLFAAFGRLSTSVCAVGRADALHVGGAHDRAYRLAFGDTDLGMRIWKEGGRVRAARAHARQVDDRKGAGEAPRLLPVMLEDWNRFHDQWAPSADPIWRGGFEDACYLLAAGALPILSPAAPDTLNVDGRTAARDVRIVAAITEVATRQRATISPGIIEAGLKYFVWASKLSGKPLQVFVTDWYRAGVTAPPD